MKREVVQAGAWLSWGVEGWGWRAHTLGRKETVAGGLAVEGGPQGRGKELPQRLRAEELLGQVARLSCPHDNGLLPASSPLGVDFLPAPSQASSAGREGVPSLGKGFRDRGSPAEHQEWPRAVHSPSLLPCFSP